MLKKSIRIIAFIFLLPSAVLWNVTVHAGSGGVIQKTSYSPTTHTTSSNPALTDAAQLALSSNNSTLVFSAPPRESAPEGDATYGPIAEYLSQTLHKTVVYKHPDNWIAYQTEMQKGVYDLVLDGPHFTSWRITKMSYNPLVKFPADLQFVVVVNKDNAKVTDAKQLAGHAVCGMPSPNLGALTLLNQFDNPARQPVIVSTSGWGNIYKGLLAGHCVGAVLPLANLQKFDREGNYTRVVYRSTTLPNQTFSAGPRVSQEDQVRIKQALLSPRAESATTVLRTAYAIDGALVPATRDEYASLGGMLKDIWGYQ